MACSWNGCVPLFRKFEGNDLSLDLTKCQFLLSSASYYQLWVFCVNDGYESTLLGSKDVSSSVTMPLLILG